MIVHMIHALGAAGPFASRAFSPAFFVAVLLRYGAGWVGGEHTQLGLAAEVAQQSASWFTHDITLWVLGLLSLAELAATKSQELRELLAQVDPLVKPLMAGLATLGFVSATDVEIVDAATALPAGLGAGGVLALCAAGGTFAATWMRTELLEFVEEIDADDSLGIAKAISWFEEFWVVGLVFLTLVLPFVFMLLMAAGVAAMAWLEKDLERRAELRKVACEHCQHPVFASARYCPSCGQARAHVCDVGPFGQPDLRSVVTDPANQPFRLLSKRRCSWCAGPLTERRPYQDCPSCQRPAFAGEADIQRYVAWVSAREKTVLGVCLVLPIVPLAGVIAAIVHYRLTLVSPYRRYIPAQHAFVARWSARVVTALLFFAQCLPGAMSVAALVNHRIYRGTFVAYAASSARRAAATVEGHQPPTLLRWNQTMVETLKRRRTAVVGALLVAAVALPVLAATVMRASGAAALALPRCPTLEEQLVGTWRAAPYLVETYEWGGRYTLQVLVPETLGGLLPETELMTLEGTYQVNEQRAVRTTIAGVWREYALVIDDGVRLALTDAQGRSTVYQRLGEPPPNVELCPRAAPQAASTPALLPAAGQPAPGGVPTAPAPTLAVPEVVAPAAPAAVAPAVEAAPPLPAVASQPTVPLTWLPLQRPWSRLHLETSECDGDTYDHLQEFAVPSLRWTPPDGPAVSVRMERQESANGPMLVLVAETGDGQPVEVLRYGPVGYTSCQDRHATVGYVGIRQDGTLLVSMERLPQQRAEGQPARGGHSLRAIIRWNTGTGLPESADTWEGRTNDAPVHLRARNR